MKRIGLIALVIIAVFALILSAWGDRFSKVQPRFADLVEVHLPNELGMTNTTDAVIIWNDQVFAYSESGKYIYSYRQTDGKWNGYWRFPVKLLPLQGSSPQRHGSYWEFIVGSPVHTGIARFDLGNHIFKFSSLNIPNAPWLATVGFCGHLNWVIGEKYLYGFGAHGSVVIGVTISAPSHVWYWHPYSVIWKNEIWVSRGDASLESYSCSTGNLLRKVSLGVESPQLSIWGLARNKGTLWISTSFGGPVLYDIKKNRLSFYMQPESSSRVQGSAISGGKWWAYDPLDNSLIVGRLSHPAHQIKLGANNPSNKWGAPNWISSIGNYIYLGGDFSQVTVIDARSQRVVQVASELISGQ